MTPNDPTPGPWEIMPDPDHAGEHPFHDNRYVVAYDTEGATIIATMPDAFNQAANARLIAAAPDLLDACIKMLGHWPEGSDNWRTAPCRAAIRKALGASTWKVGI